MGTQLSLPLPISRLIRWVNTTLYPVYTIQPVVKLVVQPGLQASILYPGGAASVQWKIGGNKFFLMRVFTEIYDSLRCNIHFSLTIQQIIGHKCSECKTFDQLFLTKVIGSRPSDHYFRSVCLLSVCLFVCLSVCAEFFSAVFDPIWIKLGHMLHVSV